MKVTVDVTITQRQGPDGVTEDAVVTIADERFVFTRSPNSADPHLFTEWIAERPAGRCIVGVLEAALIEAGRERDYGTLDQRAGRVLDLLRRDGATTAAVLQAATGYPVGMMGGVLAKLQHRGDAERCPDGLWRQTAGTMEKPGNRGRDRGSEHHGRT